MNNVILKAENLFFSYDDEKSHSLNGLSGDRPRKKDRLYGSQRLRKIHFFPVLQRH